MLTEALSHLGVESHCVVTVPKSEAEYHAAVIEVRGDLPPWPKVQEALAIVQRPKPVPVETQQQPAATSRLPELIGIATYAMNIGRGDAGNYRWHHRNATEDFEIDGQRMDAQTFMDWAEDQSQI